MTALPPPRYRVVEQDRRLVVTDRWADGARPVRSAATPSSATDAEPPLPSLTGRARQISFDGSALLTTHVLYDDDGPRTIRLDGGSARTLAVARVAAPALLGLVLLTALILAPWLIAVAAFGLAKARVRLRAAITAWLDRVEREAS